VSNLQILQDTAIDELLGYFGNDSSDGLRAKLALGSLSAVARLRATERVRDATQFHIVKAVAENEEQFREYVSLTLPHLLPAKLVQGK